MTAVLATETPGGDPFDGVAPGVELGAALAAVDPTTLVGQDAAAWMRAAFRQRNHDDWVLLGAIQEACRSRADTTTRSRADEFAPHVAAAGLGWSQTMAARRHEVAYFARDAVPALGEAMRLGMLEEAKAEIFHSTLEGMELPQCARVVEIVLPEAPGLGYQALRLRILEVARDVDADWAAARLAAAVARARVSTRTAPSGAVDLAGQDLPPDLAQDAKAHLDALAARIVVRLLGVGLDLGKGYVAARVFTRLLDGTLAGADDPAVIEAVFRELCANPPMPPDFDGPDNNPDPGPSDEPDDNGPSDDPDSGPRDEPDGGPNGGPSDGPDRGSENDASDGPGDGPSDLDPDAGPSGDGSSGDGPEPDNGTRDDGPGDSPDDEPNGDDRPDCDPTDDTDTDADVPAAPPVVVPFPAAVALRVRLSTLLGLDRHPADLPGLTGTTPDKAREIALAHGAATWHVLVHDDTGLHLQHLLVLRGPPHAKRDPRHQDRTIEITAPASLLDALHQQLVMDDGGYGTWLPRVLAAYRASCALDPDEHPATTTRDRDHRLPRTALARWIDARDHQCVAPGCTTLARRCDHDHTLDWQYGGCTQADELANLCRRHHRGKHVGRWRYIQPEPGRFEVTDPTGTVHHTRSRVVNPLPGPVARHYPFPWHLLDLDPVKPRPDFEIRPTRDGLITEKAIATNLHLALRALRTAGRDGHTEHQPAEDDSEPPF